MDYFPFFPRRCLCCGEPAPTGVLCRFCQARYQLAESPDPGLGRCPICGQVRLAEADRCVDCSVQTWSFPFLDGLFGYNDAAGELLRLYKFGGQRVLVEAWVQASAARLFPRGPLIPVPALRRRVWHRGWDPVETFVRALSRRSGLPVWKALVRSPSAVQKTLNRTARLENARLAYSLASRWSDRLSRAPVVWLVDDVVTTGATVEACSQLLRRAGVRQVRVFCLGLH
jgi:ComF family protein